VSKPRVRRVDNSELGVSGREAAACFGLTQHLTHGPPQPPQTL
jgi:hypothetical protein